VVEGDPGGGGGAVQHGSKEAVAELVGDTVAGPVLDGDVEGAEVAEDVGPGVFVVETDGAMVLELVPV
jgi:hypothetical protein